VWVDRSNCERKIHWNDVVQIFQDVQCLFLDLFNRMAIHPRIGAQLYQLMSQAGFVALNARVEYGVAVRREAEEEWG
jgi:hypothetical protein